MTHLPTSLRSRVTHPGGSLQAGGHLHHAHQTAEDTQWEVLGLEVMPCSIRRTPGELVTHIPCKPWGNLRNPEPQVRPLPSNTPLLHAVRLQHSEISPIMDTCGKSNYPRA